MRKHARNWLMKIILGIIILVFIFYFGSIGGDLEREKIASIDSKIITHDDFLKEYQNLINYYRQRYGMNLTEDILRILDPKQRAFDSLINQAVILAKSDEMKLDVGDSEVQQVIYSHPAFQRDGLFDPGVYEHTLRLQGIKPEEFEAMQRRSLRIEKLERLIKESVKVSHTEVYEIYKLQNQEINLFFVRLDPSAFEKQLAPSEEDLERYLADHGESFRIPKKVKLELIRFAGSKFTDNISITDTMIEDYYFGNLHEFSKTREEGNDNEPYLPLSDVRDGIEEKIRINRGLDEAYRHAKNAHDEIYQTEDFSGYAERHNLTIETTEFFSESALPEELLMVKNISRWAFELKTGETSPILSDDRAYYLVRLVEEKPSAIPALPEARESVERRWRSDESLRKSRLKAEELNELIMAKDAPFEHIIRNQGLLLRETGFFIAGHDIPGIGYSEELFETLFELSERNPIAGKVFFIDGSYYLVRLKERGTIDEEDWRSQKEELLSVYLNLKQNQFFQSWLEEVRKSMSASGRLVIHRTMDEI
ncbi:MAG: SurA N-terminal domain-containing protein [Syntrophales bacterium]|nr:SurA N-terminal domain-containing protein [Syntrophales bacterium]